MARRNYKFTNKRHPMEAVCSAMLGMVSLFGIIAVIYLSFRTAGGTKPGYGLTGLLAGLFSLVGFVLGILSFRKRDCFQVLCYLGTVLNGLILLALCFLFAMGMA